MTKANQHPKLGKIRRAKPVSSLLMVACCLAGSNFYQFSAHAYPIDAYEKTGIGRLEYMQRVQNDVLKGTKQPQGALLTTAQVDIRLLDKPDMELPPNDGVFRRQVEGLLGKYADRYGVSVLDLSDAENPRYAEVNGDVARNPGSVGKLVVALGLYQALADLYPHDLTARWNLLHDTQIVADEFIISDHHTVRMWDRENEKLVRRPLKIGDSGSMLEYLDWMVSPSANAAAATLTKHGMLLTQFGKDYPVDEATAKDYFSTSSRSALSDQLSTFIQTPVTRNGLDLAKLRQGSFFTRTGKRKVQGTSSYATSRELMKFMLKMEQGQLVDEFSSREIKRLMYVTERRIRYASAPALRNSAVYFKSGSWYKCEPEPDFVCKKYHGNIHNFMNSVAIVESPSGERKLHYIVTLMSNVLRRNSAVDHQTFAMRLHRLIEAYHKPRVEPATQIDVKQPADQAELPKSVD
ncbi:MAG: hypothetical protein ACI9BW_000525 [Gammaproteobacteria bacterium]|jgi:hypothetical protein